ncbi:MAG: hypothetical protein L0Y71_14805 [Gemmataceae bacterium]|nr:hypothetical protein [Gemmataceae bacterium]
MVHAGQMRFTLLRDDSPTGLLLLAIRAARRAVAVNPRDAAAHLVLGECYVRLFKTTRERTWGQRMPELAQLRRSQASAALNQALALQPNLAQAHLSLGGLYRDMGYLDLALTHFRAYLRQSKAAGAPPGVDPDEFRARAAQREDELGRLARRVDGSNKAYAAQAAGARVLDRARLAVEKGLAARARDILLQSDVAAFGPEGMALELDLLLGSGRVKLVRDWTNPEQRAVLGPNEYHWVRIQAFAASGDYARADDECLQLIRTLQAPVQAGPELRVDALLAVVTAQSILNEHAADGSVPSLAWRAYRRAEYYNQVAGLARRLKQETDLTVLRGLLALEVGDMEEAEVALRLALRVWQNEAAVRAGRGLDFNGRALAQGYLKLLE